MNFRTQRELPIITRYKKLYEECEKSHDKKTIQAAVNFLLTKHREIGGLMFDGGDDKKHTLSKLTIDLYNLAGKFKDLQH